MKDQVQKVMDRIRDVGTHLVIGTDNAAVIIINDEVLSNIVADIINDPSDHPMSLEEMMQWVTSVNKAHGWFEKDRPFSADIALLHSEVSEAYEAYRKNGFATSGLPGDPYSKDSIGAELADVFIRLLDTCYRMNIDLQTEFVAKMQYNENRDYRHGGKVE